MNGMTHACLIGSILYGKRPTKEAQCHCRHSRLFIHRRQGSFGYLCLPKFDGIFRKALKLHGKVLTRTGCCRFFFLFTVLVAKNYLAPLAWLRIVVRHLLVLVGHTRDFVLSLRFFNPHPNSFSFTAHICSILDCIIAYLYTLSGLSTI